MQIRKFIPGFIFFLFISPGSPAHSTILFSTSLEGWQMDMETTFSRRLDHATFEISHANIAATIPGGLSALPDQSDPAYETSRMDWNNSANNVDLGRTAVFNKDDTNFQWSFEISAVETDRASSTSTSTHYHGTQYNDGESVEAHIFYNDRIDKDNFDQVNAFTDILSIGKFKGFDLEEIADGDPYPWDNDDFNIEITSGPALYALAFEIVNNKKYVDTTINLDSPQTSDGGLYSYGRESITVIDTNNNTFEIKETTGELPIIPGYYNDPDTPEDEGRYADNFDDVQFIGIVSDTPFTWLEFNEDSRSDDIGIRNLRFATITAVPIPAAFWMLASGLFILLRTLKARS